jgi:rhodanese-related sulfurtransferase
MSDQPHPFARLGQEPVATIDRKELKTKLDNGEPIKLVMALNRWAFDAKHIPGSLHFDDPDDLYAALKKDDEIIVYCSNVDCLSSVALYRALVERGYRNVRRLCGWAARVGGRRAFPRRKLRLNPRSATAGSARRC